MTTGERRTLPASGRVVGRAGRDESGGAPAWWWLWLVVGAAACGPERPPPAGLMFAGLPVSGSMAVARQAGFTDCVAFDAASLRCRRHGVMFAGTGPFEAAVDLVGSDGSGGFDQVTLWHDHDQYAVYAITDVLTRHGWHDCYTGGKDWGDQDIYTRRGAPVRASMDLSYWGKRRIRFMPTWNRRERRC